jgi:hypothetical protein
MFRRAAIPSPLEGLLLCRHETQATQAEPLQRDLRDDQVSVMNRVEGSAEQADHPVLMHQPRW